MQLLQPTPPEERQTEETEPALERYATVETWAGVLPISEPSIRSRVLDCVHVLGRNCQGKILKFYSDTVVRRACADLLRDLPKANADGFVLLPEQPTDGETQERYASCLRWAMELGIAETTIRTYLGDAAGITARSTIGVITENGYFAESLVRERCGEYLKLPRADEHGFFMAGENEQMQRYGSREAWADQYGISKSYLSALLGEAVGVTARNFEGKVIYDAYFSEAQVTAACVNISKDLRTAGEDGFLMIDGVRYGIPTKWSEVFPVSQSTVCRRLKDKPCISGRSPTGKFGLYYSEAEAAAALSDLTDEMPQADEHGFFTLEEAGSSMRYGTAIAWASILPFSSTLIRSKLKNGATRTGKLKNGVTDSPFYAERDVRTLVSVEDESLPVADEDGFLVRMVDEQPIRYGNTNAWAKALGLHYNTLKIRTQSMNAFRARDFRNRIMNFYPEQEIKAACASFEASLPQADADGFYRTEAGRYAPIRRWTKELNLTFQSIERRLSGCASIQARNTINRTCDFYLESEVRARCADLLPPTA